MVVTVITVTMGDEIKVTGVSTVEMRRDVFFTKLTAIEQKHAEELEALRKKHEERVRTLCKYSDWNGDDKKAVQKAKADTAMLQREKADDEAAAKGWYRKRIDGDETGDDSGDESEHESGDDHGSSDDEAAAAAKGWYRERIDGVDRWWSTGNGKPWW